MQRDLNIAPLLINHQPLPSKYTWVKIFIYEPADIETLQSRGTMYAVLSLSAKTNFDFTETMQSILEELHTKYFQQTSGGILQTLEIALDGIHKKLILMGQQDKKLGESFKFNLLTAVSWGNVLYFGQLGSSRAALLRDGKLFDIDEGEQKSTNLYLSSGVLQNQDKVLLGTSQLFKRYNRTKLKQILAKPDGDIVKLLEQELDPGPARVEQSGIVLSVNIKNVPSPKEEALHIHDASQISEATHSGVVSSLNFHTGSMLIGGFFHTIKGVFTKKIFGIIPIIPAAIILLALVALLYSLGGGKMWETTGFGPNQALIASATDQIVQAKEVVAINPDRAQDLLNQAKQYIDQGLSEYPQNEQLSQLKSQHDELLGQILITSSLPAKPVTTLSAVTSQPKLVFNGDNVALIDTQKKQLVSISQFGQAQTYASEFYGQGALLAATDNGMVVVSGGKAMPIADNGALGQPMVLPDNAQALSLTGFAETGYLLDVSGQIYRLPVATGQISNITNYFSRPVGGTDLVDVAVDGSIYLLHQDGSIEMYLNGEKQSFALERAGLVKGAKAIFTGPGTENVYIMHSNSLMIWTKEGKYLGQFKIEASTDWQAGAVDLESDTLYVLTQDTLLKATLPE